ncbi:hypothetical protein H310_01007 [Aphanomyces invadans]|uniref:Centrosomal protein of 19 kDa n=1 Tax=Aphanomyces invadans TaxID=157072 RepID=A0A024UQ83_9STRA|nr:hypothetical protein H310_01007 [Aphanomyces invadans]ETW08424.1 hypothetical protein H310_01007 [Aphanomyces invadans]|eukprot:XP_008862229.1 hypothetical protein H310_01007 [Aphanomyces invadans]
MAMVVAGVVPKRLGLKYSPVPTLALEYEDIRDARQLKLAVVELPHLTLHATPSEVAATVQKEHELFAPSLVNEDQLVRLMQRLLQSQRDLLATCSDHEAPPTAPTAGMTSTSINSSPKKVEANKDEKGHESGDEDGRDDSCDDENEDCTTQSPQHVPAAEPAPEEPKAQSNPLEQRKEVVETTKDDSEFDESFEEESFVEASAETGSFLTQPPTTKHTDDEDEVLGSITGTFGSGSVRAEATGPHPTPVAAKSMETPKVSSEDKESKATAVDESADDIPSEEELEYFSGGDESGEDDGF